MLTDENIIKTLGVSIDGFDPKYLYELLKKSEME